MRSSRLLNTIHEHEQGSLFLWGHDQTGGARRHHTPDSPEWFAWLASLSSFGYSYAQKHFTARREKRPQPDKKKGLDTGYWYAYLKVRKQLFKRYLGKTDQLTLAHLRETAIALYEEALQHLPQDAELDARAGHKHLTVAESLVVGEIRFQWEDGILKVRGQGGYQEMLTQAQTAELLSYLYDRRTSILFS